MSVHKKSPPVVQTIGFGGWFIVTLSLSVVAVFSVYMVRDREAVVAIAPTESFAPAPTTHSVFSTADPDAAMKVYRESIVPLLNDFDERNALAADHAIITLHTRFAQHRTGVETFAKDVRSWGTRFGVVKRYPSDLWKKLRNQPAGNEVAAYVDEKFRREIISDAQLQQDVAAAVQQFEEELNANRNRLYAKMSLPLSTIRCAQPVVGTGFERFRDDTQRRTAEMTRTLAPDTVVAGIAEFSASWVATDVSQAIASRVVGQILARLGTTMAVEGIEAGGATAGGAAVGGGAGSAAGPAGTVIGLGVGLVIGAAVDWWLSDQFEARVTSQCNDFLSRLDHHLTDGNGKTPGLRQSFAQTVKVAGQAQRAAVYRAMREIEPQ